MSKPKFALVAAISALGAATCAEAGVTVIPQTRLIASNFYYTDLIGGGIGPVAVMTGGGSDANVGLLSGRNDDGFRGPTELGFSLNFFGGTYTQFWANNNGNISFTSGISAFIPTGPQGASVPVISAFFGDVDTRGTGSGVMHVRTDIANEVIITWDGVGYFSGHDDKLDSFQLVLRGPNYRIPAGEDAIGLFYKAMQWDSTDTSLTAAIGFGDGNSNGIVVQGSNQVGMAAIAANHHVWLPIPVPEPATWAMSIVGLVGVSLASRRARRPRTRAEA